MKRKRHIRTAATAAEDAISFQHSASAPQPQRGNDDRRDGEEPAAEAAATELAMETPVAEADGVLLHLSGKSTTGYAGVSKLATGRFRAQHYVGGKQVRLGHFGTAVQAAVAYARAVGHARGLGGQVSDPAMAAQTAADAERAAEVVPEAASKMRTVLSEPPRAKRDASGAHAAAHTSLPRCEKVASVADGDPLLE